MKSEIIDDIISLSVNFLLKRELSLDISSDLFWLLNNSITSYFIESDLFSVFPI